MSQDIAATHRTAGVARWVWKVVPTWWGIFDTSMAGEVLLPDPDARIAPTTFVARRRGVGR